MPETKAKKNPDYSKSAKSLTNDPLVGGALIQLKTIFDQMAQNRDLLAETEPFKEMTRLSAEAEKLKEEIKAAVKKLGGYQDIELGMYALQQVREPVPTYPVEAVEQQLPADLLPRVIETIKVVNVPALMALEEAELITPEKLKLCSLPGKVTEAWIIKVD